MEIFYVSGYIAGKKLDIRFEDIPSIALFEHEVRRWLKLCETSAY